jgi:hypothetical protein
MTVVRICQSVPAAVVEDLGICGVSRLRRESPRCSRLEIAG